MGLTSMSSQVPLKYAQAENGIPFNASGSKKPFPIHLFLSRLFLVPYTIFARVQIL